jgi:hypothetical protein
MVPRVTAKRKKGASEISRFHGRPEETQSAADESRADSVNGGRRASPEVDEHDPTPATPVESVHTTPSSEPRGRQDDEESDPFDVGFDESPRPLAFRHDEPRRHESISEDEAEADAYFRQYVTTSFYPDDKVADNWVRVIYHNPFGNTIQLGPLVTQPLDSITIHSVPNLTAQERKSTTRA